MPIQYFYKLDKTHGERRIVIKVENHLQRKSYKQAIKDGNIFLTLFFLHILRK